MDDQEKGRTNKNRVVAATDEDAAAKLWSVYVSEAEKYDRALVDSWRSDMEGMLIFAGLFSASLTAFLIESYKRLTPDSGDTTVFLLTQISHQLAAAANGNTFTILAPAPFLPSAESLICNTLWFISLGLSLSSALLATLLEQWARDFLHRANMRSDPVVRARIFSYLYYGLKRFNMHAVVEVIPLLLHASLLFFFAGLVAFLIPVNHLLAAVAASLLGVVTTVYLYLTILPITNLDCPYRTPLSGAIWRISSFLSMSLLRIKHTILKNAEPKISSESSPETVFMAVSRRAMEPSERRTERDRRSLIWTLRSLIGDNDLEPFVASIPDVLWGPQGRRHIYDDLITALFNDSDVELWTRLRSLLRSCDSGILSPDAAMRRQITCYKLFWSIASLSTPSTSDSKLPHSDFSVSSRSSMPLVLHHMVSARALIAWRHFCVFEAQIADIVAYLDRSQAEIANGRIPDMRSTSLRLRATDQHPLFSFLPPRFRGIWSLQSRKVALNNAQDLRIFLDSIAPQLHAFRAQIPHIILFDYLNRCAGLDSRPYHFDHTMSIMAVGHAPLPTPALAHLRTTFNHIVDIHLDKLNATSEAQWVDHILGTLISFWRPADIDDRTVPRGMIEYLSRRKSDSAVEDVVWKCGTRTLWSCLTTSLTATNAGPGTVSGDVRVNVILAALWRLCVLQRPELAELLLFEDALTAVQNSGPSSFSRSVTPLIKMRVFEALRFNHHTERTAKRNLIRQLGHPVMPPQTAVEIPCDLDMEDIDDETINAQLDPLYPVLHDRIAEARIQLLAEFFEHCSSSTLPYNALKTLSAIASFAPASAIHPAHQIRLANSMKVLFGVARRRPGLLTAVVNINAFDVYTATHDILTPLWWLQNQPWLDDSGAQQTIKECFAGYAASLSSVDSPDLVDRLEAILEGLDYFHPRESRD
ncbi:hypothetical protein B0H10DRAFT_1987738 [Mycena sp. CBHHK59/15]|nr:hypothetical protein B0H10DRAFT_1987738 [Mycena sp. CBHHK59/15]